jgi:hypothetical protein
MALVRNLQVSRESKGFILRWEKLSDVNQDLKDFFDFQDIYALA